MCGLPMARTNLSEGIYLQTLATVFDSHREVLVAALARSFKAHPDEPYVIEVDPLYFGLHCVSADLELISEFDIPDADAEAYEACGIDVYALTMDAIWDWIADCWAAADGPSAFPEAYANIHGYSDQYFNLSSREWTPVATAFPNSNP